MGPAQTAKKKTPEKPEKVWAGGRIYFFAVWAGRGDGVAVFSVWCRLFLLFGRGVVSFFLFGRACLLFVLFGWGAYLFLLLFGRGACLFLCCLGGGREFAHLPVCLARL